MVLAEPNRELKRPIKILREFHPSKNVFLYTMHTRAFLCPKWWVRATIKAKKKDDYWPPIQPFFDKDYSLYVVAPFSYFRILVCLRPVVIASSCPSRNHQPCLRRCMKQSKKMSNRVVPISYEYSRPSLYLYRFAFVVSIWTYYQKPCQL